MLHPPQPHNTNPPLHPPARDHDASFELVDSIPGEDCAVAGVEEGVVLEVDDCAGDQLEG